MAKDGDADEGRCCWRSCVAMAMSYCYHHASVKPGEEESKKTGLTFG